MQITDLIVKSFRNHKNLSLSFSPVFNIINGPNGSGKTNILEALSVLSTVKSFRGASDNDLVKWGSEGYYCKAGIESAAGSDFKIAYSRGEGVPVKKMTIDGSPVSSASDYYGKFLSVVLSPSDILLIDGSADMRRRYFDSVISKFDYKYLSSLREYRRILALRNSLLKENILKGRIDYSQMSIWTQMLAEKSNYIILTRNAFILKYKDVFIQSYSKIVNDDNPPELIYRNKLDVLSIDDIYEKLISNLKRDVILGYTSTGPHRDDYQLKGGAGIDFSVYGSRGQMRSASIALKIAEIEIIENITSCSPVLLVDDVYSELDIERRHNLSRMLLNGRQVIMTMPEREDCPIYESSSGKRFNISADGRVDEL